MLSAFIYLDDYLGRPHLRKQKDYASSGPSGHLSNIVTDAQGNEYPLRGAISKEEGQFLAGLIQANEVQETIEIDCAYGVSSLFICDALAQKLQRHHTIVDPHQTTFYKGIGIHGLGMAGFNWFELIEELSEFALPSLLKQGEQFDFALIDGWHTFDHALLDFSM